MINNYFQAINLEYGDLPSKIPFEQEIHRWVDLCQGNENDNVNSSANAASLASTVRLCRHYLLISVKILKLAQKMRQNRWQLELHPGSRWGNLPECYFSWGFGELDFAA
jgi:hypothetical protein